MRVWEEVTDRWGRVLAGSGIFRGVRLLRLNADGDRAVVSNRSAGGTPAGGKARPSRRSAGGAGGAGGRSPGGPSDVVLTLTDACSRAWWTGDALRRLGEWSRHTAVGLVVLLPEELWSRTALGRYALVRLYRPAGGGPLYTLALPGGPDDGPVVPVTSADERLRPHGVVAGQQPAARRGRRPGGPGPVRARRRGCAAGRFTFGHRPTDGRGPGGAVPVVGLDRRRPPGAPGRTLPEPDGEDPAPDPCGGGPGGDGRAGRRGGARRPDARRVGARRRPRFLGLPLPPGRGRGAEAGDRARVVRGPRFRTRFGAYLRRRKGELQGIAAAIPLPAADPALPTALPAALRAGGDEFLSLDKDALAAVFEGSQGLEELLSDLRQVRDWLAGAAPAPRRSRTTGPMLARRPRGKARRPRRSRTLPAPTGRGRCPRARCTSATPARTWNLPGGSGRGWRGPEWTCGSTTTSRKSPRTGT